MATIPKSVGGLRITVMTPHNYLVMSLIRFFSLPRPQGSGVYQGSIGHHRAKATSF